VQFGASTKKKDLAGEEKRGKGTKFSPKVDFNIIKIGERLSIFSCCRKYILVHDCKSNQCL